MAVLLSAFERKVSSFFLPCDLDTELHFKDYTQNTLGSVFSYLPMYYQMHSESYMGIEEMPYKKIELMPKSEKKRLMKRIRLSAMYAVRPPSYGGTRIVCETLSFLNDDVYYKVEALFRYYLTTVSCNETVAFDMESHEKLQSCSYGYGRVDLSGLRPVRIKSFKSQDGSPKLIKSFKSQDGPPKHKNFISQDGLPKHTNVGSDTVGLADLMLTMDLDAFDADKYILAITDDIDNTDIDSTADHLWKMDGPAREIKMPVSISKGTKDFEIKHRWTKEAQWATAKAAYLKRKQERMQQRRRQKLRTEGVRPRNEVTHRILSSEIRKPGWVTILCLLLSIMRSYPVCN